MKDPSEEEEGRSRLFCFVFRLSPFVFRWSYSSLFCSSLRNVLSPPPCSSSLLLHCMFLRRFPLTSRSARPLSLLGTREELNERSWRKRAFESSFLWSKTMCSFVTPPAQTEREKRGGPFSPSSFAPSSADSEPVKPDGHRKSRTMSSRSKFTRR